MNVLQVRSHPKQDLQPEEPPKDPGDVRRGPQPARHPRLSLLTLSGTVYFLTFRANFYTY